MIEGRKIGATRGRECIKTAKTTPKLPTKWHNHTAPQVTVHHTI